MQRFVTLLMILLGVLAMSTQAVIVDAQQMTAPTNVALYSFQNPAQPDQPITLTATVAPLVPSPVAPTGTVEFFDGNDSLGTAELVNSDGGPTATLTVSNLASGLHPINARYLGDAAFSLGVSPTVLQIVTGE